MKHYLQLIIIAVFAVLNSGFALARPADIAPQYNRGRDPKGPLAFPGFVPPRKNAETGVCKKIISGSIFFFSSHGELRREATAQDYVSPPVHASDNRNKVNSPSELQKNILYKGQAEVKNGLFSFSFVVPHNIAYQSGFGRISYYAPDSGSDAAGAYHNSVAGDFDKISLRDVEGPIIDLYVNDENFVSDGCRNTLT